MMILDMEKLPALLALGEGNPPVIGKFHNKGLVKQNFDLGKFYPRSSFFVLVDNLATNTAWIH